MISKASAPNGQQLAGEPSRATQATYQLVPWLAFVVAHVALAPLMRAFPKLGMLHALGCLVAGVVIAARRPLHQTAYVVSYIAGSEVLWRMVRAGVFWEYGKYACSVVLLIALARTRIRRNVALVVLYFALLLPSIALTVLALDLDEARQQISFNLSGPLCLTLCVVFFSNLRLTTAQLRNTFLVSIASIVTIAVIAYLSTVTAIDLEFNGQSNSVTSGGFGPNQVSAMLGLACMFCLLLVLDRAMPWRFRATLLGIAILFATQAALTFSRGGIALAFAGLFVASLYLVRGRRSKLVLVGLAGVLFLVGKFVVVPKLDDFTEGKLTARYTYAKTSHRTTLAGYDLEIFEDHPLLGVGPGVASSLRGDLGRFGAAHTEFTRMLAEHGFLGLISLVLLFALIIKTIRRARTLEARALVSAMSIWFLLFLLVNAMRLAAPALVFGLASAIAFSTKLPNRAASLAKLATP